MLILHPTTLLNSLISSKSFCVESSGFSIYSIMSSVDDDNFTSFLQTFMSFPCLIAIARISCTILNRSGESRHPYVVQDFIRRAFSFLPLNILAVGLS
uniref:Uncharacterized protein n=1 Tax=Sus scrofa TaxID=9823 RepID=A0A8W4FLC8_PIG